VLNLRRILEIHTGDSAVDGALDRGIGDPYLCRHNPLYAAIRSRCIELGYQFVHSGDIWQDYVACPLLCLQSIVQQRLIPYVDNATTLHRFLNINGGNFEASARFLIQILTPNHVLHESSHCIADHVMRDCGAARNGAGRRDWVISALMGEAYANTVERMAHVFARNGTHLLFLALNSYVRPELEERDRLLQAAEELGLATLFRATFLAYFVNNMTCRPVSEAEMQLIAAIAAGQAGLESPGIPADQAPKVLIAMAGRELMLSQGFLEKTTPAWFRFMGCEAEYSSLRKQPVTASLLESILFHPAIPELVRIAFPSMQEHADLAQCSA
jgi:hypothetical protein